MCISFLQEDKMNKDQKLFTQIIDRLVYLTTTDEYGSTRSQDIETFADLSEELNRQNILPVCGQWTESNLKSFIHRTKNRYGIDRLYEECDIDFIGRSSWEYRSCMMREEVCEKRSQRKRVSVSQEKSTRKSQSLYSFFYRDLESWKAHEVDEIIQEENKMQKNHFSKNELQRSSYTSS
jgi:hypothetical protein